MGLFVSFSKKLLYFKIFQLYGWKMDPLESIELINDMVTRILSSGRIKDERAAFEIARRWFKGIAG